MVMTGLSLKNKTKLRLSGLFWTSMDWLYPPRCCNCDIQGVVFCQECFSQVKKITGNLCRKCGYPIGNNQKYCVDCQQNLPPFDQMRSWAVFEGPVQKAVHSLKYRKDLALGSVLADPLIDLLKTTDWTFDLVLPVPLSRARFRERGYNQAALIARNLAVKMDIEYSNDTVSRVKHTKTQISLDVNKRFMNLMDAFYANPAKLKTRNILIIDDVITTGATMQNCSSALIKAGAEKVYCLSVARSILRHPKNPQFDPMSNS